MIPSVLSSQVQKGVEDFLKTTFPVSTPFFHGVMDRFLEEDGGIFKGPYISIKLPYRTSSIGQDFFPGIPLRFLLTCIRNGPFAGFPGSSRPPRSSPQAPVRERRNVFSIRSWITVGDTEGIVPLQLPSMGYQSSELAEENENLERALLYVSATRAKKKVVITSYGKKSNFLNNL